MPCRRHKEKVLKTTTLTARENLLKGARLAIPGMVYIIYDGTCYRYNRWAWP